MESVQNIIAQAKVAQYLATIQIANGNLYGGVLDNRLDKIIYTERKSVEWAYNRNPNDPTLIATANYLYWLCGLFILKAIGVISGGTGGSIITPVQPPVVNEKYLIPISGADFATATAYNNPYIVGKNLQVFYNDINRYLEAGEFTTTSTGIIINLAGFDATSVNLNSLFKIFIVF